MYSTFCTLGKDHLGNCFKGITVGLTSRYSITESGLEPKNFHFYNLPGVSSKGNS